MKVIAYTDGACKGNPGPGGWGAILLYGDHQLDLSGGESQTTNNRMELMAAIKALDALKRPVEVELFSDSSYLIRGMTEWLPGWKRRGWRRAAGVLENRDLWEQLDQLAQTHKVTWRWVRGHFGDVYNEQADQLAVKAIPSL
jgi:ribonuclease HI